MTEKKRDYKKEYREYHGKPEQIAARSQRNQARAKVGLLLAIKENATTKTPFLTAEAIERTISELWQNKPHQRSMIVTRILSFLA